MSSLDISLEQLQVNTPCSVDWSVMQGNERVRFCEHCQKHVHRLSGMTRRDAEKLVCESGGNLCAILEFSSTGDVLTLDYASPKSRSGWRRFGPLVLLSGVLTASLAAMGLGRSDPLPPPTVMPGGVGPPMQMGDIAVTLRGRIEVKPPTTNASTTQPTTAPASE